MKVSLVSKNESNCIKGIAILFMVILHLFSLPEWWRMDLLKDGFPFWSLINGQTIVTVAAFGGLCIPLFAFISGYGVYLKYCAGKGSVKNTLYSILRLMIAYWLTLLFVVCINIVFTREFPSFMEVAKNVFLIQFSYIPFAWYIRFYILASISYPVLLKVLKPVISMWYGIIAVLLLFIVSVVGTKMIGWSNDGFVAETLREYFLYLPHILNGSICAANNWFGILEERVIAKVRHKAVLAVGSILMSMMMVPVMVYITGNNVKAFPFFAIVLIAAFHILYKCYALKHVKTVLFYLGKYSLGIWFIHSIFFFPNKLFQGIAYFPQEVCLIVIWMMGICYVYAVMLDKASNFVFNLILKRNIRS